MNKLIVEVCCGSADDVIESFKAGADRVELNSNLFHGGLTPTIGELVTAKKHSDIEITTMVRPREGGFCYTEAEFEAMLIDAKELLNHGSDGIVFGFLNPDGTVDTERCKKMMDVIGTSCSVFHRAIDVTPNWRKCLDTLISLGVTRVLTSGQESNVLFGTNTVRQMIEYAAGRIEILPGAGITLKNIDRIVAETGTSQVHVACYKPYFDTSTQNNHEIFYGGALYPPEDRFNIVDRDSVAKFCAIPAK